MRTRLILRDGDDEVENLGNDFLDELNEKFEEKIDDVGGDDNNDGLDDLVIVTRFYCTS